ncbi:MAG: phage major capsid protein [Nitrospirae bacterium]|nr:phage major capsid protein [Nitrospirota bacterium]
MSDTLALQRKIHSGIESMLVKQRATDDRIDTLESAARIRKIAGASGADEAETFSLAKAIAIAVFTKDGTIGQHKSLMTSKEMKVIQEATQKSMDTSTGGAGGGFVVPIEYLGTSFIEVLRANSVVMRAGATLMDKLTGTPVQVPKQLTSASVQWVGQNATITASDPSFGNVQLTPKTMAIRAQYSNLLGILSNPTIEAVMRRDLAKVAALELDRVCLRGSGSSNQPLGLNGVSGIGTYAIGTNGGNLSIDDLYALIGTIEDANAMGSRLALITSPKGLRKLKKQRIAQYSGDTGGSYAVQPLLTDDALSKALGLTCLTTTQLPVTLTKGSSTDCTEVYVGNWEELLIGQWGSVEILATNIGGNAWAQNAIEVRLIQNVDVQVRHPASFVYCADARTL